MRSWRCSTTYPPGSRRRRSASTCRSRRSLATAATSRLHARRSIARPPMRSLLRSRTGQSTSRPKSASCSCAVELEAAIALLERARSELAGHPEFFAIDLSIAETALELDDAARAAEALAAVDALPPGMVGPIVPAQAARLRARIEASSGDTHRAEESFKMAAAAFREYGMLFLLARTQLDHAEWLASRRSRRRRSATRRGGARDVRATSSDALARARGCTRGSASCERGRDGLTDETFCAALVS